MAPKKQERLNLITSYGLLWKRDQMEFGGSDRLRSKGRLLGRLGNRGAGLHVCNFWSQGGVYVLYGNDGPYYMGITKNLGTRLRRHMKNQNGDKWHSFSWFGTREVEQVKDAVGLEHLAKDERDRMVFPRVRPSKSWQDFEALFFRAFKLPGMSATPSFGDKSTVAWEQVGHNDVDRYLRRAATLAAQVVSS